MTSRLFLPLRCRYAYPEDMRPRQRELTGRACRLEKSSAVFLLRRISHAMTQMGNLSGAIIRNATDYGVIQQDGFGNFPLPWPGVPNVPACMPAYACSNRILCALDQMRDRRVRGIDPFRPGVRSDNAFFRRSGGLLLREHSGAEGRYREENGGDQNSEIEWHE